MGLQIILSVTSSNIFWVIFSINGLLLLLLLLRHGSMLFDSSASVPHQCKHAQSDSSMLCIYISFYIYIYICVSLSFVHLTDLQNIPQTAHWRRDLDWNRNTMDASSLSLNSARKTS